MTTGMQVFLGIVRFALEAVGFCGAVWLIDKRWGRRLREVLLKGVRG